MRSAMPAASQLPGKDPLMWMMPLHLQVNQKPDYDDMMVSPGPPERFSMQIDPSSATSCLT